ncbi:rab-like protein 3 [Drosophila kikkawai]|uniref:Rab-like protein 3 n=1 Tax=Drosophila kikkawai TaxID=30033 RepID=A0A6P4JU95_DROKI|nr:rab-like protein 3 [Drosophila kikkawai]
MSLNQLQVKDVPTVRILMLGDKGVGKTSVTNLMACSAVTPTPASRSIGQRHWNIQIRLHEYPNTVELPPSPTWTSPSSSEHSDKYLFPRRMPATSNILYFVEFFDISTQCRIQREQRKNMLKNIDGIVLVYNLQDLRSQDNLHDWLYEPLRQISKHRHRRPRTILGSHHVPILVVGTRLDKLNRRPLHRSTIAHQLNAEEILLNSQDTESFADKSRNQGKLRDFLNRVVEFKDRYPLAP